MLPVFQVTSKFSFHSQQMEYIPILFYICFSWISFFVKIFSCLLPFSSLDSWCFLPIWICSLHKVILIVVDAVSGGPMERKNSRGWRNLSTWDMGLLGILFCFSSSTLHSFNLLWAPGSWVVGQHNQCLVLWQTLAFGQWEATSHLASSQLGCQGMVAFLCQKPQMLSGSLFCSSRGFLDFGNHSSPHYLGLGVAVSPHCCLPCAIHHPLSVSLSPDRTLYSFFIKHSWIIHFVSFVFC